MHVKKAIIEKDKDGLVQWEKEAFLHQGNRSNGSPAIHFYLQSGSNIHMQTRHATHSYFHNI